MSKMGFDREDTIRETFGASTNDIIDRWHSLCKDDLGTKIEVGIADRHDFPATGNFAGELHTALPMNVRDEVILMVLVDSLDNVSPEIFCHEVLHWILFLEGFRGIRNQNNPNSNIEIILNSLAHHVPLYEIQRDFGQDPQDYIDDRASDTVENMGDQDEPSDKTTRLENALLITDDFLNCSGDLQTELFEVVDERHPRTQKQVNKMLSAQKDRDLTNPEENKAFLRECVRELGLRGNWQFNNDVAKLKEMID